MRAPFPKPSAAIFPTSLLIATAMILFHPKTSVRASMQTLKWQPMDELDMLRVKLSRLPPLHTTEDKKEDAVRRPQRTEDVQRFSQPRKEIAQAPAPAAYLRRPAPYVAPTSNLFGTAIEHRNFQTSNAAAYAGGVGGTRAESLRFLHAGNLALRKNGEQLTKEGYEQYLHTNKELRNSVVNNARFRAENPTAKDTDTQIKWV